MKKKTDTQQLPIDVAKPETEITTLPPAARAEIALKATQTEADMRAMVEKHKGLVEIKDKAGREQVHGAAMELMRARTAVKNVADEAREDAKKFNQAVIDTQKRLTAIVEPEETRLKALRDAWDTEQERIKREAEEKEQKRILDIGARIQQIREFGKLASECRSSDAVARLLERVKAFDMTGFDEFDGEAVKVRDEILQRVENVLNTKLATEAEAARLKAEREELERKTAEAARLAEEVAAAQKAEADRLATERAELERMKADFVAAQAAIPDVVAPEKQDLADAVREVAGVGIAIADDLLAAPAYCCEKGKDLGLNGVACPECAAFSAACSADMAVDTTPAVRTYDNGAPMYSTTTFKDNGQPIMLTPEGKRSIFCDIADGDDEPAKAPDVSALPDADLVDTAPPIVRPDLTGVPSAAQLIWLVAHSLGVDMETACQWLCARIDDIQSWTPAPVD